MSGNKPERKNWVFKNLGFLKIWRETLKQKLASITEFEIKSLKRIIIFLTVEI